MEENTYQTISDSKFKSFDKGNRYSNNRSTKIIIFK
nr:MAG TPA: hypothetical protein [Caudoviricetes sp.]